MMLVIGVTRSKANIYLDMQAIPRLDAARAYHACLFVSLYIPANAAMHVSGELSDELLDQLPGWG